MGRKRRRDKHLPQRMYLRSGTYYLVQYGSEQWINLGRDYVEAMRSYGEIQGGHRTVKSMGDVIDRYMIDVAPKST